MAPLASREDMHPVMRRLYSAEQPWTLRSVAAQDDETVASLLNDVFVHPFVYPVTLRFLRWLLRSNPAGDGLGWVAETRDRFVAYASLIPYRMRWRDGEIRAMQMGPLYVTDEFRNQGLFLRLADESLRSVISPGCPVAFTLGQPPAVTKGFCKFLGWKLAVDLVEHVFPLDAEGASRVSRAFRAAGVKSLSGRILRLGATLESWCLRAFGDPRVRVGPTERFDGDMEEFLEHATQEYQWAAVRNLPYLEWRYLLNPRHRYKLFVARRGRRICGYMVLNVNHEGQGVVVDLFTALNDLGAYAVLLAAAIRQFVAAGANSIRIHQHRAYWANATVRRVLPFVRSNLVSLIVLTPETGDVPPTPEQARAWHVCLGDTDDEGGLDQLVRTAPGP